MILSLTFVAAQDEPTEITVFRGGVTIDWDNDPIILELERQANVDVKFVTSGWGDIGQVRNLALASEEDIDIYHHMDLSPQWIEDEVIIALDDYINPDDHPYLYNLVHSDRYSSMKRDGKVYYVPMVAEGFDWVFLVRQDWMDELGLDYPTDEVEFRAICYRLSRTVIQMDVPSAGNWKGRAVASAAQCCLSSPHLACPPASSIRRRTSISVKTVFWRPS